MAYDELVAFEDAEAIEEQAGALHVRVRSRMVWVPHEHMAIADGVIAHAGDRGRLILPRWVAIGLGLIIPNLVRLDSAQPSVRHPPLGHVGRSTRQRRGIGR